MTDDNRLKVTDFGLTRAKAQDVAAMTAAMTQCGTPYWSAPEVRAFALFSVCWQ